MGRLGNDVTVNMVSSNLSPPNPIDSSIDLLHQIVILQFHIDSFFHWDHSVQHVTDDYHQPEIFIVPLNSYHTRTNRTHYLFCTMATGCYSNWVLTNNASIISIAIPYEC